MRYGEQIMPMRGCWLCGACKDELDHTNPIYTGEQLCNICYDAAIEYLLDPDTPAFNGRKCLVRWLNRWPALVRMPTHPLRAVIEPLLRDWLLNVEQRKREKDVSE